MDRPTAILLPILIAGVTTVAALGGVFWLQRRIQENLAELAAQQGLQIEPQPPVLGIFPKLPQVTGLHQGRTVRFYCFGKNNGENRQMYSVVAARYQGREDFVMLVKAVWNPFRSFTGPPLEPVLTEDGEFDQKFPVKTTDPMLAKNLLTVETRAQITTARQQKFGRFGRLKVERGEVSYTVRGGFSSRGRLEHLVEQLELVCRIAQLMENRR